MLLYIGIEKPYETKRFIYKRNAFLFNMVSSFRETIIFFEELGVYDVILPFLLVFCIVFAILEKSKIFGTEKRLDRRGDKWVEKVLEMAGASEPARDLRYPIVDGEKD